MKDEVKIEMPNRTPKTLIPSNGVLRSGGRLKGDHATHL
jgi:hypothetical protein